MWTCRGCVAVRWRWRWKRNDGESPSNATTVDANHAKHTPTSPAKEFLLSPLSLSHSLRSPPIPKSFFSLFYPFSTITLSRFSSLVVSLRSALSLFHRPSLLSLSTLPTIVALCLCALPSHPWRREIRLVGRCLFLRPQERLFAPLLPNSHDIGLCGAYFDGKEWLLVQGGDNGEGFGFFGWKEDRIFHALASASVQICRRATC